MEKSQMIILFSFFEKQSLDMPYYKYDEKAKEEKIREVSKYLYNFPDYELYDLEELFSNDNYDI